MPNKNGQDGDVRQRCFKASSRMRTLSMACSRTREGGSFRLPLRTR